MRDRGTRRGPSGGRPQNSYNSRGAQSGVCRDYQDARRGYSRREGEEGRLSPENKARRIERFDEAPTKYPSAYSRPSQHERGGYDYGSSSHERRQQMPDFQGSRYSGEDSRHKSYHNERDDGFRRDGGYRAEYGKERDAWRGDRRIMRGGGRGDGARGGGGRGGGGRGGGSRGGGSGNTAIVPAGTKGFLRSNVSEVIVSLDKKVYKHRVEITYRDPTKLTPRLRRLILIRALEEAGFRGYFPYDGVNSMVAEEPINITDVFEGRLFGLRADGEINIYPTGDPLSLSDLNSGGAKANNAELVAVVQMIVDEASRAQASFISGGAYGHQGDYWLRNWGNPNYSGCPVTLNICHKNALGMICVNGRMQLALTTDIVGRQRLEKTTVDQLADAMDIDLDVRSKRYSNPRRLLDLLKGLKVTTKHLGYDRPIHIVDIKDETAESSTLEINGKILTLAQYYLRQYNIKLQRPYLRILVDSRGASYPPEILHLESQAWSQKFKAKWQAEVPKLMAMASAEREAYFRKALQDAFGNAPILEHFGIEISQETITPVSQVLRAPVVRYANREVQVMNGAWNLQNVQMLRPAMRGECAFVNLTSEYRERDVRQFYQALQNACAGYGLDLSPLEEKTYFERVQWEDALRQLRKLNLDLVFVLINRVSEEEYGQIKLHGDRVIPTQVIVAANTPFFRKRSDRPEQHLGNLALKINNKLGGTSHGLAGTKTPFECFMQSGHTVIMGADICHSGKTTIEGCQLALPSYAALVATVDKECSQQTYSIKAQSGGPDIMMHMCEQVIEVLNKRDQALKRREWPKQIIYLRDGFSDSSIEEIRAEAEEIKRAYKKTAQPHTPSVLAIAVRKRQMTRFFAPDAMSHKSNVMPGVVVLDDLNMPSPYPNFYLVSHAGIKGTTIPTRYIVVYDDFHRTIPLLKPLEGRKLSEAYAEFCYQMCALFPRCTRTVSYPGPVYSAHSLAERGSKLSDQMGERLYYYPERGRLAKDILDEKLSHMIDTINHGFSKLSPQLAWL